MKGRPRKPVELKLLEGSRIRPADRQGVVWDSSAECPPPPSHLDNIATQEWLRVAPGLHAVGLLPDASLSAFQSYCVAYAMVRQCTANNWTAAAAKWMTMQLRWMSEFGMTPATAGKVSPRAIVEGEDPANEWMRRRNEQGNPQDIRTIT